MTWTRILFLLVVTAMLAGPPEAESCGPFLPTAQFSWVKEPAPDPFARGRLGILRPRFRRRYLVVAFRYLTGAPLTAAESAAFGTQRAAMPADRSPLPPLQEWMAARNLVPRIAAAHDIDLFRPLRGATTGESYQNCFDDAFRRAARTLRERSAAWGAGSSSLKDWVAAQDAVFENCGGGAKAPSPAASGADPLLKADRRYQIAAAEFYSEQYDAAERDFRAIAADAASPWRDIAPLLVARVLIREAVIGEKPGKLAKAKRALDDIAADGRLAEWHGDALALGGYVAAKLDPRGQLNVLATRLMQVQSGPDFSHDLTDFTMLCDDLNGAPLGDNELPDWIGSFQAQNWAHALERWRAHPSDAWLLTALAAAPPADPAVPALLEAAKTIPATSPAWASAAFYGISLEMKRGETANARGWADEALKAAPPPEVKNDLLALRLRTARDWEEFLRFSARTPVAANVATDDVPLNLLGPGYLATKQLFDSDFTGPFNAEAPLARWIDAASNPLLPPNLRADIAKAGWVRAVILDRSAEARKFAPEWPDPGSAKFEAILLLLRTPGLQPWVRDNFGRMTASAHIDDFRDNWWSITADQPAGDPAPAFLPDAERTEGRKEWRQLLTLARTASDYLCGQTVTWVRAHPEDPRAAEALYLAVRTTRFTYGKHTTTFPKQAFTLLHTHYPKSKWAAQTPYWY